MKSLVTAGVGEQGVLAGQWKYTHWTQSTINNTVLVEDMRKKTTYIHHQHSAELQSDIYLFFFVCFLIVY